MARQHGRGGQAHDGSRRGNADAVLAGVGRKERRTPAGESRSEKSGFGLGLPIIKQESELVGAAIDVESDAENGTAFTVRFELTD